MSANTFRLVSAIACAALLSPAWGAEQPTATQKTFATPEEAGQALVSAAEKFDVTALKEILGPDGIDLVVTDDPVLDKQQSTAFAAQARQKTTVVRDPKSANRATLVTGAEDWPMPVPLIQKSGRWLFDSKAGRQEVLYRRIGDNELDAITICHGYVEAQFDYASQRHDGALVNQYAQHVISTPGKQDGLAWQAADGSWEGPVGENIAKFLEEGYTDKSKPYHGYYFKVVKKQGPAAPMGEMNFVVKGVMIGGFAMVAAPATYRVTGVKTFIVGNTGIVYEKDLGPTTLDQFRAMDRFNPDKTWKPVAQP